MGTIEGLPGRSSTGLVTANGVSRGGWGEGTFPINCRFLRPRPEQKRPDEEDGNE